MEYDMGEAGNNFTIIKIGHDELTHSTVFSFGILLEKESLVLIHNERDKYSSIRTTVPQPDRHILYKTGACIITKSPCTNPSPSLLMSGSLPVQSP
jgi:hypothetical protein